MIWRVNMWFWWFILLCDLLVPIIMFVGGIIMSNHCPNHINGLFGYRTVRSMKNMDTWKFAHEYCGKLWWKIGWISVIPSILVQLPFVHSSEDVVGIVGTIICIVQCILLIVSIFPTENALKRTFFEDGTRK